MKFLRLLESWKFSWSPVTLPVRIKYKYCKSTNLEILNTVQGQRRATSLLLKWSRIQFQNSISDSEMHTMWFKSSLFYLECIDQSELGSNTDNLTSTYSKKPFSTVLKYEFLWISKIIFICKQVKTITYG